MSGLAPGGKGWVFLSSEQSGTCLPVCCGFNFSEQPSPWMGTHRLSEKPEERVLSFGGWGWEACSDDYCSLNREPGREGHGLPGCPSQPRDSGFDLGFPQRSRNTKGW